MSPNVFNSTLVDDMPPLPHPMIKAALLATSPAFCVWRPLSTRMASLPRLGVSRKRVILIVFAALGKSGFSTFKLQVVPGAAPDSVCFTSHSQQC